LASAKAAFSLSLMVGSCLSSLSAIGDQVVGVGLGDQQVRAGRLIGDQAAAVEAGHRADAARNRRGGAERQGATHAIALDAGLAGLVGLGLGVEEGHIGDGVALGPLGRHGGAQGGQLGPVVGIGEVERLCSIIGAFLAR
jgi:hypothetical protein